MKKIKHDLTPTQQTVISIANEYADCLTEDITPDSEWFADLGIDSLDLMEINIKVEQTFSIELPEERLEQVKTVGQLAELIDSLTDGTL